EDRRLDEQAGAQIRAALSAEHAARALLLGDPDVIDDLLELRPRRDRPDLGVGERRIAQLRGADEGDQLLEELVVDASLQQEARARLAALAGRRENPRDHTLDRLIEIGIVENDVR